MNRMVQPEPLTPLHKYLIKAPERSSGASHLVCLTEWNGYQWLLPLLPEGYGYRVMLKPLTNTLP